MTTPKTTIPVLDMTPQSPYADGSRHYRFPHSYPWVRTTDTVRDTIEAAYEDAREWARVYAAADPYGNMACTLGVAARGAGYVGVVNYYHSNT